MDEGPFGGVEKATTAVLGDVLGELGSELRLQSAHLLAQKALQQLLLLIGAPTRHVDALGQ